MTEKLLPCPFCGGEAESKMYLWGHHAETHEPIWCYYIYCTSCDAMTDDVFKTEEEAIAAWNRRDHIRDTTKKVSYADRIRSMSDEELARWLVDATVCERVCDEDEYCHGNECVKRVTDWLKQPVKEG